MTERKREKGYQPTSGVGTDSPPDVGSSVGKECEAVLESETIESVVMRVQYPHSEIEIMSKRKFNMIAADKDLFILQIARLNDNEVIVEYYRRHTTGVHIERRDNPSYQEEYGG